MDTKRLVIGSVVGAIVLYAVGYLFWSMLFADFFAANAGSATGVPREASILWAEIVGVLSYGLFITLALGTRSGDAGIGDGAKVGASVGFLIWFTVDIILFANFNLFNLTAMIADSVLEGIRAGIAGAVISAVLAKVGG